MANTAQYKLATQAILMAYELLAPDPQSANNLKQHLAEMQKADKSNREREYSDREVFFETMHIFDKGLKGKWFYRD